MKLGYVIIYVKDVAETVAFYEQAFGLTCRFKHDSGSYSEMETGATALAFAHEDATPSSNTFNLNRVGRKAAGVEIALCTDSVETAFAKALEAGAGKIVAPILKPWGQTVAYVTDNNGCLVELCTPMG